jgi:hypothetical protein
MYIKKLENPNNTEYKKINYEKHSFRKEKSLEKHNKKE